MAATGLALILLATMPVRSQQAAQSPTISREDVDACLACHSMPMGTKRAVSKDALAHSAHASLKCQDCHTTITAAPHTPEMLKEKATCAACHPDEQASYAKSIHARTDKAAGDHPTCVSCHGGGDPHAIAKAATLDRRAQIALCSNCHRDKQRMARYGPDTDAVPSYEASFHGKALLRYGNLKVAICTDCHGHHDVLAPADSAAPTNRANVARTCGQPGCHPGAKTNFAMSGANHLRLKMKDSLFLRLEDLFFIVLTVGTITILLIGVALDLLREITDKQAPRSGRPAGIAISLSFLCIVATLIMSYLGIPGKRWPFIGALILFVVALILRVLQPRREPSPASQRKYLRLTLSQRLQHGALALSFIGLVLSGLPLRYANVEGLRQMYLMLGGLGTMRVFHRTCGVIMIATWIWHTVYLLYRWWKAGFTLSSWTMFPTFKDVRDFFHLVWYYFGLAKEPPKFERFQLKEKFDYFAVYWGMPIMVLSGLVLWFPVMLGNWLPEIGVSAALIAHSDEAVLAFVTIVTWHFYNTHFNPERFPINLVFWTGTLTEEEMARDHPLELERIKAAGEAKPDEPAHQ